jgi:hypothetical protein
MEIKIQYTNNEKHTIHDIDEYEIQDGFLVLKKNDRTEYLSVDRINRFAVEE